ncbi:MAG: hypothetical protein AAGJ40_00820 [Planctomycetota bacterium]
MTAVPALSITLTGFSRRLVDAVEQAPMMPLTDVTVGSRATPELESLRCILSEMSVGELPPGAQAGLWLLAGNLETSHGISQNDASPEGSYWHGIMHRREGDYSNAGYWFNRVGRHAVIDSLAEIYPTKYADGRTFVGAVRDAVESGTDDAECAMIQWDEWQRLLHYCLSEPD